MGDKQVSSLLGDGMNPICWVQEVLHLEGSTLTTRFKVADSQSSESPPLYMCRLEDLKMAELFESQPQRSKKLAKQDAFARCMQVWRERGIEYPRKAQGKRSRTGNAVQDRPTTNLANPEAGTGVRMAVGGPGTIVIEGGPGVRETAGGVPLPVYSAAHGLDPAACRNWRTSAAQLLSELQSVQQQMSDAAQTAGSAAEPGLLFSLTTQATVSAQQLQQALAILHHHAMETQRQLLPTHYPTSHLQPPAQTIDALLEVQSNGHGFGRGAAGHFLT